MDTRTYKGGNLFDITADDTRVTVSEPHIDYLSFEHHSGAHAANTVSGLLDRAYALGYQTAMQTANTSDNFIPLPGEKIDGDTVIASVVLNDTDYTEVSSMVLLLTNKPGHFYRLVNLMGRTVESEIGTFPNIVPAVEAYVDNGGDY